MSYTRTTWVESETPLSAQNMNNIEDGIEELQAQKVDKTSGKGLSTNDYTTDEKTKLAGIEAGAEVNVQSDWIQTDSTADDYIKNKPVNATTSEAGFMSAADKSKLNGIAAGAQVNPGNATTSAAGLMSAADKTKLNGIATGAEVNQNAFSNVKVGSTTVAADGKTDTLELVAGTNVTLTSDATNDKVTIIAKDTTYSAATTSAAGLMSAADKTKLNGIAAGAQVNRTYTAVTGKPTANASPAFGGTVTVSQVAQSTTGQVSVTDRVITIPNNDATASAHGLMSASDKTKLNGVSAEAKNVQWVKYTVDDIEVSTGTTTTGSISVSQSGWSLIGVIGFYFEDSSPAVIADTWKYITVSRLYASSGYAYYAVRLDTAAQITSKVKLSVYCLYTK